MTWSSPVEAAFPGCVDVTTRRVAVQAKLATLVAFGEPGQPLAPVVVGNEL